jgi:hypothetical protein
MSTDIGKHVPTSEFRASLERDIVGALRAENEPMGLVVAGPSPAGRAHEPPSLRRSWRSIVRGRLRNAALIAFGLFVGVGAQMASAQVQESRQRSELEAAKVAERQMAALRIEMAKLNEERARKAMEAGAGSRESLLESEAETRRLQVAAVLLELEIAEIRATSASPRHEIWAPLTTERDFLRERLQAQGMVMQQRLAVAEARAQQVERSHAVGAATATALSDARLDVARSRMDFHVAAKRIMLRDQFLKEGLSAERVARDLQHAELQFEIQYAQEKLKNAQERERTARQQSAVGATTAIELKRAELEVLEVQLELQQMMARYRELQQGRGGE